jgi:Secretion system C-terminal sorting domain
MKKLFLLTLSFLTLHCANSQCSGYDLTITSSNPICYAFSDGSLTAITTGGNGGDIYTITDSLGNQLNLTNTVNNLLEGWYYVHVEDNMGCELEDSVYLDAPDQIDIDYSITNLICQNIESGSIEVDTVYNATGDYNFISYYWAPNPNGMNGVGQDSIGGLADGTYSITINDENGCSNVFDIDVLSPPALTFADFDFEPCTGGTNGVVFMSGAGGTPDYEYTWTNLGTGDSASNTTWGGLSDGCYEGTITDANGCFIKDTACVSCLSVAELDFEVSIYPNPSNGLITINSNSQENMQLILRNMNGAELYFDENYLFGTGIDFSEIRSGIYILQLSQDSKTSNYRLILE